MAIPKEKKSKEIKALELDLLKLLSEIQKEIEIADVVWDKACRVGLP